MTDTSMRAAIDMSHGSPRIEDIAVETGPAVVEGAYTGAEGGSTTVESGGAAVEGDKAHAEDGIAAVAVGGAAESMAEAEGLQHIPQFAATAYAPGSSRPRRRPCNCGPLRCLYDIHTLCPVLYGSHVDTRWISLGWHLCPKVINDLPGQRIHVMLIATAITPTPFAPAPPCSFLGAA